MQQCKGNIPLKDADGEIYELIQKEKERQLETIELIASENFTSRSVMECAGSCLTNKYSEGYPNARYYGGNEIIDQIENLCIQRCLQAFRLSTDEWGVNVQPYSGSPANFAVYTALLNPHDRIMGLDLPSGGHLTHGFYTAKKRISASSIFFESFPYKTNEETGLLDYVELKKQALVFRPKLIIAGHSAYPRDLDYKKFREIADEVGAILMADMAHVAGLVAGGVLNSPFEDCDIVTTTVHKTLRGPRSALIFFNKKRNSEYEQKINGAVFPALQGGPHNHQIAAVATQMKQVMSSEWSEYANSVVENSKKLASCLINKGYKLVTNGTDNHLILWDLRPNNLTGGKMQLVCDYCGITLNKNAVHGDTSAVSPSGIRIGTPAMTSRNVNGDDWKKIAEFLHQCVLIAQDISKRNGKKLVDFQKGLEGNESIQKLRKEVNEWARQFPMPGL